MDQKIEIWSEELVHGHQTENFSIVVDVTLEM